MHANGGSGQETPQERGIGIGYEAMKKAESLLPRTQKNPRVLFVTRSLDRGGAERQLVTLAVELRRSGWDIAIACFYSGGAFQTELDQAGVPVIDLRKHGRWDTLGFLWRLLVAYRVFSPDIVHGNMHIANMLALLARFTRRRTCVVWGVRSSNVEWQRDNRLMRPTFWLSCKLARYADCIIANSQTGADYHVAYGYPRARMVVIPNGIDTGRFHFDPAGRDRLRAEWGISRNEVLVGVVARLDPMKDHLTFLKAAAMLADRNSHWRFACVGEGPASYTDELRVQAGEFGLDGRLIFTGARDDMSAVYSAFDIACSSSWGEGFPNVVAEAMACERPCVVTDVGDSARIVADCGIVVPAKNPEALAEAIERTWGCTRSAAGRSQLGSASRARVLREFSANSLAANSTEILLRICRDHFTNVPTEAG